MITYIRYFSIEDNIIQKDIRKGRSKNGTLWHSCNHTFLVTKSVAYSNALDRSESRPKTFNFAINGFWFRVSNALERSMITTPTLFLFFNCVFQFSIILSRAY